CVCLVLSAPSHVLRTPGSIFVETNTSMSTPSASWRASLTPNCALQWLRVIYTLHQRQRATQLFLEAISTADFSTTQTCYHTASIQAFGSSLFISRTQDYCKKSERRQFKKRHDELKQQPPPPPPPPPLFAVLPVGTCEQRSQGPAERRRNPNTPSFAWLPGHEV
ncbi:hypothetical protein BC826DRAFT_1080756, partial [Russula brevipes]